uniref:Uncharacterized protein n=1 Tax=Morchella importuna TaxID=1174673 RepID=A0A650AG97_9PEZI|nr:hypothetical protein [Morchella importuna]QGN66719.1 hypothetical protein [Morchella importuna]
MWKYKLYVVYRATHTGLNTKRIHQKTAGGTSHYYQRVKLYKIKMKNNFSSLSTGQMLAIYYTNKKQVQLADDMAAGRRPVFIVVLYQMKVDPNTTFFYYDNRSSRIVNHLVYRGKSAPPFSFLFFF